MAMKMTILTTPFVGGEGWGGIFEVQNMLEYTYFIKLKMKKNPFMAFFHKEYYHSNRIANNYVRHHITNSFFYMPLTWFWIFHIGLYHVAHHCILWLYHESQSDWRIFNWNWIYKSDKTNEQEKSMGIWMKNSTFFVHLFDVMFGWVSVEKFLNKALKLICFKTPRQKNSKMQIAQLQIL